MNGSQFLRLRFWHSKIILITFTIFVTTALLYLSAVPVETVFAELRPSAIASSPQECIEGNRILTTLFRSSDFVGPAPDDFYYSFNIINPSGRLQVEHIDPVRLTGTFFSLHDSMAAPWNQPITWAQEGPGRYTIQVYQVEPHKPHTARPIGTVTINLPCETPTVPPGTLRVVTEVRGGPGIPPNMRDISEFRLQVLGNIQNEPFTAVPGGNTIMIPPGFFRVNQLTSVPDYTVSFSGNCDSTGRGRINSGDNQICTVTYTYNPPATGTATLRVFKEVINDNLGLRQPGDFALRITGGTGVGGTYIAPNNFFAGIDESHGGTTITLRPGMYSVSEIPSSILQGLYTARYSPECSGNIAAGQTITCTVTNDDIRQGGVYVLSATQLAIEKSVIPPLGSVQRFPVDIEGAPNNVRTNLYLGTGPGQGQTVTIQTGGYRVVERPTPAGYAAIYSNDCTGTLTGEPAQPRRCDITNVAVIENASSNDDRIRLTPEAQQCLQNPSCISLSHIPSSLITCLQDPQCIRTLTISTGTGMTTQLNITKKDIITQFNEKNKTGNFTQKPLANSSSQMMNSTYMGSMAGPKNLSSKVNLSKDATISILNTTTK